MVLMLIAGFRVSGAVIDHKTTIHNAKIKHDAIIRTP
jgi:hypothetical protein